MEHLETRLLQLNTKLLKLAEHRALLHNGRYSASDIPNDSIISILKDNNSKNRAYSNALQDIKNMETISVEANIIEEVVSQEEVEPDIIEEAELDIIEEAEPTISPTESNEIYTYKRKPILISEDYTATMDDYYIGVKSEGSIIITIPCDCDDGHEIVVKSEMNRTLENIKITIMSMDDENLRSIDDELEYVIESPYQSVRFLCRDTNWWTI